MSAEPAQGRRVAALVVTHNRLDQLRATVARLLAEPLDHVLIVDNASTDGTSEWLAAQPDRRIEVLRLAENRGGAGGFEAGMAALRDGADPDWTVLMDDDARPAPGAIAAFRAATADIDPDCPAAGQAGAVAGAVFLPGGALCEMNRPSRNPFWHPGLMLRTAFGGGRRAFHLDDPCFRPDADPVPIDAASFVGLFVSRAAVARAGLPDGRLFIYSDDVLYCLRLRRCGVRIVLHPAIRFEHDCATLGSGLETRPLWKVYYLCRNGVLLARQAAGPVLFPMALGWYVLAWWRKARHYAVAERKTYRRLMLAGIGDGLRGRLGRNEALHAGAAPTPAAPAAGRTHGAPMDSRDDR